MGPCSAIYHAFAGYLIYYGAQIYPSEKVAGYWKIGKKKKEVK